MCLQENEIESAPVVALILEVCYSHRGRVTSSQYRWVSYDTAALSIIHTISLCLTDERSLITIGL